MSDCVLNKRTGVLHRYPAFESCNVDAMKHQSRAPFSPPLRQRRHYRRDCTRCFVRPLTRETYRGDLMDDKTTVEKTETTEKVTREPATDSEGSAGAPDTEEEE